MRDMYKEILITYLQEEEVEMDWEHGPSKTPISVRVYNKLKYLEHRWEEQNGD